jgi:hypothetical protein
LITGSIPTENLPKKSHEAPKRERRSLVRHTRSAVEEPTTSSQSEPLFSDFDDFTRQLDQKSFEPWQIVGSYENEVRFEFYDKIHGVPKYSVVVNSCLEFTVFVYNWPVPDLHSIYKEQKRSIRHLAIEELLRRIESSSLCMGLQEDEDIMSVATNPTGNPDANPITIVRHTVPKAINVEEPHFEVTLQYRSVACDMLVESSGSCKPCVSASNAVKRAVRKKSKASAMPAKPKASLEACGPEKLRATVKSTRLKVKDLESRLKELQRNIEQRGIGISEGLEKDILKIMGGQNLEATPHMKFFWQEQMKLLQSAKMGRRYHPQVIRFALSIHAKSPSAYREIQESGALILPSERVLRDYKNYFKPKAGINKDNVESLREKTSSFTTVQRYVAVVMDEMKLQSNLVFDKGSGDLIGFIDLGDPMTNFANLTDEDPIATHALAFLVRGLCTDLKHIIAYFFTGNVTSFQIMPLFWRTVSVLEVSLNLRVCAAVNDGASPNRKFFRLHSKLAANVGCDVVYKTRNIFAPSRFIFFFADSPHLMKTARNCLYNSGYGSRSRLMWNDGQYLQFQHVADLFYSDQDFSLHTLPKLTLDHITLTSFSKMKVKLAVQVLSKSVAIALQESGKEDVVGTAKFCEMMNSFFDCTNVRSLNEGTRKNNSFIVPYESPEDARLTWLKDVFLNYLERWKESILAREGGYTPDAQQKMFISAQTYEGLKISVNSHIDVIKFLLSEGFKYVLTERFMQDVLEDYFGHQREKGRRSENPTAQQFGYNDLTIATQRDIAPVIRGNVGGRYEKVKWHQVSEEPVKKRKKK